MKNKEELKKGFKHTHSIAMMMMVGLVSLLSVSLIFLALTVS